MDTSVLTRAWGNANVVAFSRTVREGESSQTPAAYHMRYGGAGKAPVYFADLSRHPQIYEPTPSGKKSSAAGAYQATYTTWSEERARWGWTDFSEKSQDEFFVARLIYRKALDAVIAGRFDEACALCHDEWTSLPGGSENNAATARARDTYVTWGGKFEPVEESAAPKPPEQPDVVTEEPEEESMDPVSLSLIAGLAGKLLDAFSPLAQEKVTKELARHTDNPEVASKVAGAVVEAAKSVTKIPDEVAAVAAAKSSPAVMAQVEQKALANLSELAPLLDKVAELDKAAWDAEEASRDAASKRAALEKEDQDPFLTKSVVFGLFAIALVAAALAAFLAYMGKPYEAVLGFLTTAGGVVVSKFGTRYDHRYGSSRTSNAKDIVVAELSKRR